MSTINWLVFQDFDSRDHNVFVRKKNTFDRTGRDLSFISVPGRDGDIVIDNKKHKNIEIEYELSLFATQFSEISENENFFYSLEDMKRVLVEDGKYYNLYDSYTPEYYRKACLIEGLEVDNGEHWSVGQFSLTFNCKPFLYRIDGDEKQTITAKNTVLYNPEMYDSLPYIKIYGNGDIYLHIGGGQYNFLNVTGFVECDSDSMNVYKQMTNKNNDYQANSFPVLSPGNNTISWAGNVSKIEITPRWRTR